MADAATTIAASEPTTVSELVVTAPKAREVLRRPRARMLVDGEVCLPVGGSISRTNDFQADTFRFDFSLYADRKKDATWWQDRDKMEVDIQLAFEDEDGGIEWKSTLTGIVDRVMIGIRGRVSVHGRDRVALFDRKTRKAYMNKTSSEVAEELAGDHGMEADVQATTTKIGSYYKGENMHHGSGGGGRSQKEWDLLVFLARKEGFSVWVEGNTLFFKDVQEDPEVRILQFNPYEVEEGLAVAGEINAENIEITKDFNASPNIYVEVNSWHTRLGRSFKSTAGKKSDDTSNYYYRRPNLNGEQTQEYANQRFAELTRGEYLLEWSTAGDYSYTPRQVVRFDTPPGAYLDKDFYIEEVNFDFGYGTPFMMRIRAKTTPPQSGEES